MVTYCTQQNLIDRYGSPELVQITNPDNLAATTINVTVLNKAIADATAEIDGYLTGYLPLSPVPANFERLACDITRYHLYDDLVTEQVKERYKNHISYLIKVAEGKISIAPDAAGAIDQPSEDVVTYQAAVTVFNEDALSGF